MQLSYELLVKELIGRTQPKDQLAKSPAHPVSVPVPPSFFSDLPDCSLPQSEKSVTFDSVVEFIENILDDDDESDRASEAPSEIPHTATEIVWCEDNLDIRVRVDDNRHN